MTVVVSGTTASPCRRQALPTMRESPVGALTDAEGEENKPQRSDCRSSGQRQSRTELIYRSSGSWRQRRHDDREWQNGTAPIHSARTIRNEAFRNVYRRTGEDAGRSSPAHQRDKVASARDGRRWIARRS